MAHSGTEEWCGVCLSEAGKTSRGEIDCCQHYFCFVCIMEWAKVQSSCPLCKRRFTTIRRPPKHPIFPHERLVHVPLRTQVSHPMGIVSTGPHDPFARVKCSVCDAMGEETLLLLCDLCDMAYHTYCIGLGDTVPEGDWACHDCNASKAEHFDIMDMVRSPQVVRLAKKGSSNSDHEINNAGENIHQGSSSVDNPGSGTLGHLHNVHNRIQALRENWNSLQNGTISFSSIYAKTSTEGLGVRRNSVHQDRSDIPCSSSRKRSQQPVAPDHKSGTSMSGKDPDAVRKAWGMMGIAKRTCNTSSSAKKSIQLSSPKEKSEKAAFSKRKVEAHPVDIMASARSETRKQYNYHSAEKNKGPKMEKSKKKQQEKHISPSEVSGSSNVLSSTYLQGHCGLPGSRPPEAGMQRDPFRMSSARVSREDTNGASSNISGQRHHSSTNPMLPPVAEARNSFSAGESVISLPCNVTSGRGRSEACNVTFGAQVSRKDTNEASSNISSQQHYSSSSPMLPPVAKPYNSFSARESVISPPCNVTFGKERLEASFSESRENLDDAKREIQTLVKLNLKRLTKEKPLEVNAFKDVARRSTHSILAACGLEQPKYGVRSFPTSKCSHMESNKSNLMPDSCRKCFWVFVKNVVSSILFDKAGSRSS